MDDSKQLKRLLQRIAEKHVPGNVDLWPRIEKRITQQKPRRSMLPIKRQWSFSLMIAAVLFSMIFFVGAYALSQFLGFVPDFDYGMNQVWRNNLGTDLGMSQIVDDVIVTLNHAYADANRIVVYYTAAGGNAEYAPAHISGEARLTDSQGRMFEQIFGGGGGGGGGGGPEGEAASSSWELEGSHNFDARMIEGSPSEVSLHLELVLQIVESTANEVIALGPYTFDFTVPFIPAVVVEPQLTVMTDGLPMTLEWAAVTPSSTKARVCFDVDDPEETWMPIASMDMGDRDIQDLGFLHVQPRGETIGNRRCVEMDFLVPYAQRPTRRTLVVERLQGAPAWNPAALAAGLEEYGIQIEVHEDEQRFEVVSAPPGVDIADAIHTVQSSLSENIEGPWVFTLDIP